MTPAERAALKAEMLEAVAAAVSRNLDTTQSNLLRAATKLRQQGRVVEAAQDRVAPLGEAIQTDIGGTKDLAPEPAGKEGDSGERPFVANHSRHHPPREHWVLLTDHNRLVSWLDADRERRSARIAELERLRNDAEHGEAQQCVRAETAEAALAASRELVVLKDAELAAARQKPMRAQYAAHQVEAAAAVLRKALIEFENDKITEEDWCALRADALATGAGAKLLERIEKLERFVRAADALEAKSTLETEQEYNFARAALDIPRGDKR